MRPFFRRLAIVSVLVLTPLAAHAIWGYIEVRRLVSEIEAIRARREPVTERQAGRGGRPLTEEQARGGRYYLAAAALAGGRASLSLKGIDEWREWLAGATASPPDRAAITARLGSLVQQFHDALRLVDAANSLPFNGFGPGTEYSFRAAQIAHLSRLVSARTLLSSLSDRGDEAARSALASLRLRRALRDTRWLGLGSHEISSVLSLSKPSVELLGELAKALDAEDAAFSVENEIAAERARYLDLVWQRYYGSDPSAPHVYSLPMRSVSETIWRPWFTHKTVATLRKWSELIEAARRPWPEKATATADVWRRHPPEDARRGLVFRPPRGLMSAAFWLLPGSSASSSSAIGTFVADRCARTAIAVELFRRDHTGRLPVSLAELVPRYVTAVATDPLSGGPLRFKPEDDAYTIYSVGTDGKDDGGDLSSELREVIERGWGRRALRGRDLGVRVLTR